MMSSFLWNSMKKPNENQRAKSVEKIIRLAYSSLESHLNWTHAKTSEGIAFHKQAVKEYVSIIQEALKLW